MRAPYPGWGPKSTPTCLVVLAIFGAFLAEGGQRRLLPLEWMGDDKCGPGRLIPLEVMDNSL